MSNSVSLDTYKRFNREVQIKERKKGFAIHLLVYVLMNIGMVIFNLMFTPETLWCIGALVGWGSGLAAHYITGVATANKALNRQEEATFELARTLSHSL